MSQLFDVVVVGGGVVGLMSAARLAATGQQVLLAEGSLLGSGATTSNHGIVHSGALYARLHPEVVPACRRAQRLFRATFPDALVPARPSWYVCRPDTLDTYRRSWDDHDITHEPVAPAQVRELLPGLGDNLAAAAVDEAFIDTRTLLIELASRCIALGVELRVGYEVGAVVVAGGRVQGVLTAHGPVHARHVVLCAGIDTARLLGTAGSRVGNGLASRLEMMLAAPGGLTQPVIGLEFGWPVVVPSATTGTVLASRYGGVQPRVHRRGRWPVSLREAYALTADLDRWFRPGALHASTAAAAWVCSKTEYVAAGSDRWNTAPNYAVLDHGDRENIAGLWTVLPGKMTLSLHASRDLTARLTGHRQPLSFPSPDLSVPTNVETLVAYSPWATHLETNQP